LYNKFKFIGPTIEKADCNLFEVRETKILGEEKSCILTLTLQKYHEKNRKWLTSSKQKFQGTPCDAEI
jgi:hypothetical protein